MEQSAVHETEEKVDDFVLEVMNDIISECSGSVGSDGDADPQIPDTDESHLDEADLEELTVMYLADVACATPEFENVELDEVSPLPSIQQLSVNCDQVDCESEVSPTGSARLVTWNTLLSKLQVDWH